MKILKQLFCKHEYQFIENSYARLGWVKCKKCDKEKYDGSNTTGTHFKLGKFDLTEKND